MCIYIHIHINTYRVFEVDQYLKYFGRSADALFSLFTNVRNSHINKYKVKSATLQKLPMRNIHNKLNIFKFLFK